MWGRVPPCLSIKSSRARATLSKYTNCLSFVTRPKVIFDDCILEAHARQSTQDSVSIHIASSICFCSRQFAQVKQARCHLRSFAVAHSSSMVRRHAGHMSDFASAKFADIPAVISRDCFASLVDSRSPSSSRNLSSACVF